MTDQTTKRCECGAKIDRRLVMCSDCFQHIGRTGQSRTRKWKLPSDGSTRGHDEVRKKWNEIKGGGGD